MPFNEHLKQFRLENNKTQKEMAALMEVSERTYQFYEKGEKEPTISKIQNLCKHCNVDLNYLLKD
ncbi:helix-turn-helix domain-containing protein [Megamonas hypermegale]|uniref:helix-turn-helix domain-containing protein n=1 Tax=Megamonas hypermegale TaxID=158847 RepID=UPI0026ECBCDB|nr:helix-turn-helix transcriptional regulator [Megamonas hypermegale]